MTIECPVSGCGYNANMNGLTADQARPLDLTSTRSHEGEDAWRDMDHFDLDEELSRLRRAVHEVRCLNKLAFQRHEKWAIHGFCPESRLRELLAFIAMAFDNIDEMIVREGPLPNAWMGSVMPRPEVVEDNGLPKEAEAKAG